MFSFVCCSSLSFAVRMLLAGMNTRGYVLDRQHPAHEDEFASLVVPMLNGLLRRFVLPKPVPCSSPNQEESRNQIPDRPNQNQGNEHSSPLAPSPCFAGVLESPAHNLQGGTGWLEVVSPVDQFQPVGCEDELLDNERSWQAFELSLARTDSMHVKFREPWTAALAVPSGDALGKIDENQDHATGGSVDCQFR